MLIWLKIKGRRDGHYDFHLPQGYDQEEIILGLGQQQQEVHGEAALQPNGHPNNQENPDDDDQQGAAVADAASIQEDFHVINPQYQQHDPSAFAGKINVAHVDSSLAWLGKKPRNQVLKKRGSFDFHFLLPEKNEKVDLKISNRKRKRSNRKRKLSNRKRKLSSRKRWWYQAAEADNDLYNEEGDYGSELLLNPWQCNSSTGPNKSPDDDDLDDQDSPSCDLGNAANTTRPLTIK